MKRILFVTIVNLFCLVSLIVAKPADRPGTYTESIDSKVVCIETNKYLEHRGESYKAKESIDIKADEITANGSTYRSPIITMIAALGITLSKSNFDGVLSLDGKKITIKDCMIKSLVITNYEKVDVELLGNTVIEEGVMFVRGSGLLKAESTVKIQGGIKNGKRQTL